MKNIFSILISLFIAATAINCSDDDDNAYPVYDREVNLAQNDSVLVDLGAYPIEGGREITQQARHSQISEMRGGNYFYKPSTDFIGEDQVEVSLYGSSGGDDSFLTGVLRITLLVNASEN